RSLGATGTWNIFGGTAQTKDLSVGRFERATGTLNVTNGSLLLPNHSLIIGREGAGHVNISGGSVIAGHVLIATNTTSSGTVAVTGGELITGEFTVGDASGTAGSATISGGAVRVTNDTQNATLLVANGTMTVGGASMQVDSLVVTNTSSSLHLNDGTIQSSSTLIKNGQPFVVGDGTHPAVFRLNGGTHTFSNGLVISQNASVIGCGQIIGAIQNSGTLSTNCGGTVTAPTLSNAQRNGAKFTFTFQSEANVVYTVEYKDNLTDPAWTKLSDYTGTGGSVTVTDDVTTNTRFYRVVIF
ncbi:MAG TPA: hypothetical protein VI282_11025, partial [Verrucomicrobiae bacterium]